MSNKFSGTVKCKYVGSFLKGQGTVSSVTSKSLNNVKFSVPSEFKNLESKSTEYKDEEDHSNPEEFIAAALSSCFNITLSVALGKMQHEVKSIETECSAEMTRDSDGYAINDIYLNVNAIIHPVIDQVKFDKCLIIAKERCSISKLINGNCKLHIQSNINKE